MTYPSVHTGPEVDAAVSELKNIQAIRLLVEEDRQATEAAASQAATNSSAATSARNAAQAAQEEAEGATANAGEQASQAAQDRLAAEQARREAELAAISAGAAILSPMSRAISTSGDTWSDLVTGSAVISSVTLASTSFGPSRVSMRIMKGSTQYLIVPDDELPQGASARLGITHLTLELGDKLQVKSVGGVDWVASGGVA